MKRILIAALAILSFVPAFAEGKFVTVSGYAPLGMGGYQAQAVKVAYGDLDTTSAAGAAALLDRINQAARLACGERMYRPANLEHNTAYAKCRSQAVAHAVESVGAPTLTQIANAR
jgi:UrcA family protein